ncbi:MAG: type II toxin-antitoxin system CcdA family antitoxin [Rhodanobacteraceae bacterium]|nr:type II toxin-antitoxin system CcdA family antitoxin [Rhodanobacteraceae bacterium]
MTRPVKKATNLSIRTDLLEDARALDINLSRELETHLENVIRQRRAEQWKRDNREAIEAYNRHIERDGLWSDEFRTW